MFEYFRSEILSLQLNMNMMKRKNQVDVGMLIQILQWTWNSCLKTMNKKSRYTLRSRLASPCLGFVMWHGVETQPHHDTGYFLNFICLFIVEFCTMFLVDSSFNYWSAGDLLEDFKYLHKMSWDKRARAHTCTCSPTPPVIQVLKRCLTYSATHLRKTNVFYSNTFSISHFKQDKCEFSHLPYCASLSNTFTRN